MRLIKHLTEAVVDDEKLIADFHKNTTQWKKEMKGQRVWRATNDRVNDIELFYARKDRRPKDTPLEVHNWFDGMFKKKFGWKARSEGVFASTNPNGLEPFGKHTYLMYPANGYSYVWSPKIEDLTDYASKVHSLIDYNGMTGEWFTAWGWEKNLNKDMMKKDMNSYTNKNLPKASNYSTEVMFNCPNGYYLIESSFFRSYALQIQGKDW